MAGAARRKPQKSQAELGLSKPRLAPPIPARSKIEDYEAAAKDLGIDLMPWQRTAARYITALGPNDKWLYRRVAVEVGRQNGKTEIIKPRVLMGFLMGRKQLHIAQDRLRPRRSTFEPLADALGSKENREKYGIRSVRYANGQEQILCTNGASYTILAPESGGARGGSYDDVYIDEVQEFQTDLVDRIVRPTTIARPDAQIISFGSAGDVNSIVLNAIRRQRDDDPRLAYLEWSAAPERAIDDRDGWREANPAIGFTIDMDTLEDDFRSMQAPAFETEHLCRWVVTMQPHLITPEAWERCQGIIDPPKRPAMGISVDPAGTRATAVIAWRQADTSIAMKVLADVTGDPVNITKIGSEWQQMAIRVGAVAVGFDPWTDTELSKYFRNKQQVNGRDYANASNTFRTLVDGGTLHWADASQVSEDLPWTARKPHESGAWMAVKAKEDRPITAVLAAIRAVGMAADPPKSAPRVL